MAPKGKGVGRFQVMAVLQAARARALGLPADTARSWGLNRAIYIAARKRGFKEAPGRTPKAPKGTRAVREYILGQDDKAFAVTVDGTTLFTIGGEIQTPAEFRRQIEARFGGAFAQAWEDANVLVAAYPRDVLESAEAFFMKVYRPRRDVLASLWTERAQKETAS